MYHRIRSGPRIEKHTNSLEMLRQHLMFLKEHYPIVLPGDPLPKGKLALCLTFDDATFDFYYYLYPLIKELKIKVLLGIPVQYILESTQISSEERLKTSYSLMMQEGIYDQKAPFCTWSELEEMVASGHVEAASHSFSHSNLTFNFVDLKREIELSKAILEERLSQPITSFIYPFGRMTLAVQEHVSQHYPYAFRIGSALNFGWGNGEKALCRIPADNLNHKEDPLSFRNLSKAFLKALIT